jgi:hypothetical protein
MYSVALIVAVTGRVISQVTNKRTMVILSTRPCPLAKAVPTIAPMPTIEVETGRPYPK